MIRYRNLSTMEDTVSWALALAKRSFTVYNHNGYFGTRMSVDTVAEGYH